MCDNLWSSARIGPLYINNLTKSIKSSVRLFADDCLIYHTINSPSDQLTLQEDLDILATCGAKNWQMKYYEQKCSIMQMTKQHTLPQNIAMNYL